MQQVGETNDSCWVNMVRVDGIITKMHPMLYSWMTHKILQFSINASYIYVLHTADFLNQGPARPFCAEQP